MSGNESSNSSVGSNRSKKRKVKGNSSASNKDFNPQLILSQMIALQSMHYFILCILVEMNHIVFGSSITIDRIFTDEYVNIRTTDGWVDNSAVLFSSLTG